MSSAEPTATVEQIHAQSLIVEGHRDCYEQIRRLNEGEDDPLGRWLIPRLQTGGVDILLYAVGGDSIAHSNGGDKRLLATLENISALMDGLARSEGRATLALSKPDLPSQPDGTIRFVLHLEGGGPLEGSLAALESLFRLGVRSIQPAWNLRNELADGVRESDTEGGLSRFGVAVLREMEQLGMLVDLAHISEAGFWHAIRSTTRPLAVSHSNAKAVHDHPRNITDDQLKAIAERGGVVGVHALPVFVDESRPTIDRLVDHIAHMVGVAGIEHVGIGGDFVRNDGPRSAREQIPKRVVAELDDLGEIDELPNLTAALFRRGFDENEVTALVGGNFVRLLLQILPD